jgi:actin related protein 2/3 complex subunit 2
MAMILLPLGHRCLTETCQDLIEWQPDSFDDEKKDQHRRNMKVEMSDYDNVSYQVKVVKGQYDNMLVSMNLPFLDDIRDVGAQGCLDSTYAGLVADETENNYNITLNVPFSDFKSAEDQKALTSKISLFKSNLIGSVFHHFFEAVNAGTVLENFMFDLRSDTQIYFVPSADRVAVIFGIDFEEKFDKVLARIFLTEFQDARRRIGSAPPVSFDVNPTRELADFGITEATGNLGFISFSVLKSHVSSQKKRDNVANLLQGFRTYLQYHIKCSKSFFHSRMRKRCVDLLKVLNRAKVKNVATHSTKEKTVIKGKNKGV